MREIKRLRKIVITGPESTGKTELSEALAKKLHGRWIPEYARGYVEKLGRRYNSEDLEFIARHQIRQEYEATTMADDGILIFDTWLIITKIWFEVVYGKSPVWIEEYILNANIDIFLVCSPDLPWIADQVRENGGEMRHKLFEKYCLEIEKYGFKYEIVTGFGEDRLNNALKHLESHQIG